MAQRTSNLPAKAYQHAVVIGGSIAGLIAARVLTQYFERVTVIERDVASAADEFRKGVPQAKHPHVLLVRGQRILEQLFPGLFTEMLEAGAVPVSLGSEIRISMLGRWLPQYPSTLMGTACSRPMLEEAIYRRLASNSKLVFRHETEVSRLCVDAGHVTGVEVHPRNGAADALNEITADLVVDASGRDSKAPEWLAALGYPTPEEISVNAFPGYATRIYECPAGFSDSWKGLLIQPAPPNSKRGAVLLPLEGNRWHVTMIGMGAEYPPTDEVGFLEYARSLSTSRLYDAIKDAQPLSPIVGYRRAENRLRRYDQLPRYLDGFLVFGDAVYAFNPIYGQGMTVAAMGGMTLDECLRQQVEQNGIADLNGLALRFQKELGKVIAFPWQIATGEDMRWPDTEGKQKIDPASRLIQGYMNQVIEAVTLNPKVTAAFHKVQNMVEPPTSLMRPAVMFEVFKTNLSHRFSKS